MSSFNAKKTRLLRHLYGTKYSFFPDCKRVLYITTFELLRAILRNSFHNMVAESVRFALL